MVYTMVYTQDGIYHFYNLNLRLPDVAGTTLSPGPAVTLLLLRPPPLTEPSHCPSASGAHTEAHVSAYIAQHSESAGKAPRPRSTVTCGTFSMFGLYNVVELPVPGQRAAAGSRRLTNVCQCWLVTRRRHGPSHAGTPVARTHVLRTVALVRTSTVTGCHSLSQVG